MHMTFIYLLLLLCSSLSFCRTNLALNKSCTIIPKPNYPSCTDEFDNMQLTDGKMWMSHWRFKSTVGWGVINRVVEITIDLEKPENIDRIRIHSIGGKPRGVVFPKFIAVFVSNDGRDFEYVGLLADIWQTKKSNRTKHQWLEVNNLNTNGRFVKILMKSGGKSLFLDEIEVIRGQANSKSGNNIRFNEFHITSNILKAIKKQIVLSEKITATVNAIEENRNKFSKKFAQEMNLKLDTINEAVIKHGNKKEYFEQMRIFDREVDILRAEIYNKIYGKSYVFIPANPMEILKEKQMYLPSEAIEKQIDVQLWQNEHESIAVNIINCTDTGLYISTDISSLLDSRGNILESHKTFTVRKATCVQGSMVGAVADALVLQGEKQITVKPGQTVQLWIDVFNPSLKSGNYAAFVKFVVERINGDKLPEQIIPVNITVVPISLDYNIALETCVWAFPEVALETKNSLIEAIQDLQLHYTNIVVTHSRDMPFPQKGTIGQVGRSEVDYSSIDRVVSRNNYARTYLFYFNWRAEEGDFGLFGRWMSPQWKDAFASWLTGWIKHLKETGVSYDRFALYPFDETLCDKFYELAGFIKNIDPEIRIYANSFGRGPKDFERFKDRIDIWCLPNDRTIEHLKWFTTIKSFGVKMWVYGATGPAKANSPYNYYRLMPWYAFKRGQTGAGFWLYVDYHKEKGWDDGNKSVGYYGVIYGANIQDRVDTLGESIVPSRRWQAWREGLEDYQYLYQLQKAINDLKKNDMQRARKAQNILDAQVDYVLENPNDSKMVYRARHKITAALLYIEQASSN